MKLYSYFRSSAAYRVRIALNLKGLAYDTIPVHLVKDGGHNRRPEFRAVNPQMRVPVLVAPDGRRADPVARDHRISGRDAPRAAVPAQGSQCARARRVALAEIIACDIHPLNNTSTLRYLKHEMHQEQAAIDAWYHHWVSHRIRGARNA